MFSRVTGSLFPAGTARAANHNLKGRISAISAIRLIMFAGAAFACHAIVRRTHVLPALCGYRAVAASHYAELIQENIATSRSVPAGVMAATRSQGHSLLSRRLVRH